MTEEIKKSLFEDLKKTLGDKVDDDTLNAEIVKYVDTYEVPASNAKMAILKKYNGTASGFVTADSIEKKISDLKGNEMNVDIVARTVFVDKKDINIRGSPKTIVSGILGDDTGTCPFTIWEGNSVELEKGQIYTFKNAYTKTWNGHVQVNLGTRGRVERKEGVEMDVSATPTSAEAREVKIGEIKEGSGNVTVTGRILSTEKRDVNVKGETKTVYSGILADDTGKIQYSAWSDYDLKEGETICVKNAYIRAWRGIPQLNLGDRCEVDRVDDIFTNLQESIATPKTIGQIINVGGALDVSITGTVVDLGMGSGLIKRCPECNRSVLNDECTTHGKIESVFDLRMKIVIDDGTGALSAIIGRADTEKLTGITLEAAENLAKARGDMDIVGRDMADIMLMKKVAMRGNVLSDEYGPKMVVKEAEIVETDVIKEAQKLYKELEESL